MQSSQKSPGSTTVGTDHSPWRGRALVLALTVVVAGAGVWAGIRRNSPQAAGLIVPQDALKLGDVWAQKEFQWRLPLNNPTGRDIEVLHLRAGCNCTEITPRHLVVPAGGRGEVQLTLDLTEVAQSDRTSGAPRRFEVDLRARTRGGGPGPRTWTLRGRVRTPFAVTPSPVRFPQPVVAGDEFRSRTAEVEPIVPLKAVRAEVESQNMHIEVSSKPDNAGRYTLRIRPSADLPVGHFRMSVRLRGMTAAGKTLPPYSVPVEGEVLADIHALPSAVDLSGLQRDERFEEILTVQSRRGSLFEVQDIRGDGPVQVRPLSGGLSDRHALQITGEFATAGRHSVPLEIEIRRHSGPAKALRVPVSAYVVAGDAAPTNPEREEPE